MPKDTLSTELSAADRIELTRVARRLLEREDVASWGVVLRKKARLGRLVQAGVLVSRAPH